MKKANLFRAVNILIKGTVFPLSAALLNGSISVAAYSTIVARLIAGAVVTDIRAGNITIREGGLKQ